MVNTLIEAGLTEAETVLLERSRSERTSSDDEKASFWSETVVFGSMSVTEAISHLSWLRPCTRSLIITPRFQRLEYALAPRLLEAEVLGGRAVRGILKAADIEVMRPAN